MKTISGLEYLLTEMDPNLEHRAAELVRRNEALRAANADLARRLAQAESGNHSERAAHRAALNLMEDALEARRAAQIEIAERQRAEAELRESDRRKDEFLATLGHELRSPLATIRNGLYVLLRAGTESGEAEQLHGMMERQIVHMARLIDDLLDVSRIGQGKIELRMEPVDLVALARGALEVCQASIEGGRHHLEVDLADRPLTVHGDPVRLVQVTANLLNNAAKYTEPGGRIWLSARAEGADAALIVRDSGAGIPAEMLPRIFDLFAQADCTFARSQGGLGIGLTLARRLIDLHGGTIEARSDGPGTGSEFKVALPLWMENPSNSANTNGDAGRANVPARVLLVDDNRDATDTLSVLLQTMGHDVLAVNDGRSALEALASFRPSVVLLDLNMPEMDGHEVARRAREQTEGRELVLVALTGWGREDERRRLEGPGFDHHLTKPVKVEALQALLGGLGAKGRPVNRGGP